MSNTHGDSQDEILTFSTLDPSQKRTFEQIVSDDTETARIVYGPPGTGKSQLVVSLLENLAASGKTVLFVSQNTEALRVVGRMIRKTEKAIGYSTDDDEDLSLLDFALRLYEPTQRKLKYLREHFSKLNMKRLPRFTCDGECSEIKYPLAYIDLDALNNDELSGDIGFDEMVAYYLKYVTQNLAPETLREFENVQVREVFRILDEYPYKKDFEYFVHPKKELLLLSAQAGNLNLPEVRAQMMDLRQALTTVKSADTFKVKVSMSVDDYLMALIGYERVNGILDIYRVETEKVSIEELRNFVADLVAKKDEFNSEEAEIKTKIEAAKEKIKFVVEGVTCDMPEIKIGVKQLEAIGLNFKEAVKDFTKIVGLISNVESMCPGFCIAGIEDLCAVLSTAIMNRYKEALNDAEGNDVDDALWSLTSSQVQELNTDAEAFLGKTGFKKLTRSMPSSFVNYLGVRDASWVSFYIENFKPVFDDLMTLVDSTGATVSDLICWSNQKSKIRYEQLEIGQDCDLVHCLTVVIKLKELLEKYSIPTDEYNQLCEIAYATKNSLDRLVGILNLQDNDKLRLRHGLESFVMEYNNQVELLWLQEQLIKVISFHHEELAELFKAKSQFFDDIQNVEELYERSAEILELLEQNQIFVNSAMTSLELPLDDVSVGIDGLEGVRAAVLRLKNSGCFSEFFFEIGSGQNLDTWFHEVSILETYSNNSEMADFVEHNRRMSELYRALGAFNKGYLDEILSIQDLTFAQFAARLVNTLIQITYGNASLDARKHVDGKTFLENYRRFLRSQKAMHYADGLRRNYERSCEALRLLARQDTLKDGDSVFEKFRNHTREIIKGFPIVCATPKEVAKYIAPEKAVFDYVIFDEASQLLPGQALPAIFRAKKAIIIGDPHQMPPSLNVQFGVLNDDVDDIDDDMDLGESILDLMRRQPLQQHHLKVHYRSKYNKLFEPSRKVIYGSEGIEPIFESILMRGAPIDIEDNLGEGKDEFGFDSNFYKICDAAIDYLAERPDYDEVDDAVFCILFARAEVLASFRKFLAEGVIEARYKVLVDLFNKEKILLSTVTNCQGIEGLFTIIYLQYYKVPSAMWFFKESVGAYKRLNVAITRQKEGLKLILANPKSAWTNACEERLNNPNTGQNAMLSAKLMKALLENAGEETGVTYLDRTLARNAENFDSPLTEQLYKKLVQYCGEKYGDDVRIYSEVGWNLRIPTGDNIMKDEKNVGFRIDLGVFSVKQGKFILGIEMDGAMYHSGFYKEQSDYNRQDVLEKMKGWRLYRIWSTNWLNDEQGEFLQLTNTIDEMLLAE